jgi:hypothetical protein
MTRDTVARQIGPGKRRERDLPVSSQERLLAIPSKIASLKSKVATDDTFTIGAIIHRGQRESRFLQPSTDYRQPIRRAPCGSPLSSESRNQNIRAASRKQTDGARFTNRIERLLHSDGQPSSATYGYSTYHPERWRVVHVVGYGCTQSRRSWNGN